MKVSIDEKKKSDFSFKKCTFMLRKYRRWIFCSVIIILSYNYSNGAYFYTSTFCCFIFKAIWHFRSLHVTGDQYFYTKYLHSNWWYWRYLKFWDKIRILFFLSLLTEFGMFLSGPYSKFIWFPVVAVWIWESLNQFFFLPEESFQFWSIYKYCFTSYFCIIRGLRFRSRMFQLKTVLQQITTPFQFEVFLLYLKDANILYDNTLIVMGFTLNLWILYNFKVIWQLTLDTYLIDYMHICS